jgi:uncharacterized cysteine cluster protein YcgN (CxxCxxCC family)
MWDSGYACPLYSIKENRCSNYENRQQRIPECSQITPDNTMELYEKGVLSDRCNYVRHMRGEELVWDVEPKQMKSFVSAPMKFQQYYWRNRGKL